MQETWETEIQSLVSEDLLEKEMTTCSNNLAWEIHGQRGLVGYGPWGSKELEVT